MEEVIQLLKLFGGIGLFMFSMNLLEDSLKNLAGRNFKLFLQKITKTKIGAVLGGAVITAILQSSSMVSLMVLAFVGAGIFAMKTALAIILGANLGTTANSWLVATLGFKVDIEIIAFPAAAVGGLLLSMFRHRKTVQYVAHFLFGFGLLFIGIEFLKTAMEAEVKQFDISQYTHLPLIVFVLLGFALTVIVQSSSATMAITLSALHAGGVELPAAAALVLGSEAGTTVKILFGSIGGNASKRRVALGSFLINIIMMLLVFAVLKQFLYLITYVLKVSDPLISLVTFQSLVNVFSIVVFLPVLDYFARFLETRFRDSDMSAAAFIGSANINESETAIDLFRRETEYFVYNSMLFNLDAFGISHALLKENKEFHAINERKRILSKTAEEKYEFMQELQGELQLLYIQLQTKQLSSEEPAQLDRLISTVRSAMHSVKCIKDIRRNISDLQRSSKNIKYDFFVHHKKETEELYRELNGLVTQPEAASFDKLKNIFNTIQQNYSSSLSEFYKDAAQAHLIDTDITTIMSFNRELFTSNKAMLMAVKDLLLKGKEAEEFNEISVYKT